MNIHLGITYRGRLRDMKRILVVKAMVLGAIACSINAIGFAAGVGSTHIQDVTNMQQSTQGTEKHEAVQSNWMDRTDIKVGTQSKVGTQISVETLQPLTHYDENSKSVLFVQGGMAEVVKNILLVTITDIMRFGILIILQRVKVINGIEQRSMNIRNH